MVKMILNHFDQKSSLISTTRALIGDMSVEEFKHWLRSFDTDRDGRLSRNDLRRAIRAIGGRFSSWKSGRWIKQADTNGDGFIDEDEIVNLVEIAKKSLGLKIASN